MNTRPFFIHEKTIVIIAAIFSIIAIYFSYTSGAMLAYNDATAHLNTARRITDNLTPGFVQIGSVWLPLLHIFEMPFAAITILWSTGLAGAIVSGISFVIGSLFLYKLLVYVTKNKWAGFFGVLFFLTNINMLYLQTTAMFEPLLIATATAAVYFFAKWTDQGEIHDLVLAAFCIMLATLTRYDGWALFIAGGAYVLLITIIKKRKLTEGPLITYLFLAGFGIVLWLIYNQLIFSDPLYFMRSEFSAKAQQDILQSRGQLNTKHDLVLSAVTYTLAVILNNGIIILPFCLVGLLLYIAYAPSKLYAFAPFLLLIPYAFNILSLYLGQSVIWLPILPPYFQTYFNIRYGILILPSLAFFGGFLAGKHILFRILTILVILAQVFFFLRPSILPITGVNEGIITLKDTVSAVNDQTRAASAFLHSHHTGGLILVSSASADAFIFRAGLPLKYFITEGTGYFWKESLQDPRKYATWIVFFKDHSDRVGTAMKKYTDLEKYFQKDYEDQTYVIYQRVK